MGIMKVHFRHTKGVCCFSPLSCSLRATVRIVIRATHNMRVKAILVPPGRISSSGIIRPLGPIVHVTASSSRGIVRGGGRGRTRTCIVYGRGVTGRKLSVGLITTRCAFSGGGLLFCFATSKQVSFHRLIGSLTSIFHAHVRLQRVNIHSRAGVLNNVKVYKERLYYESCLASFMPMSVGVTGRRGLSLGPAGVSNMYNELVYYLGGRRRACRCLGDHLPLIKSSMVAPAKVRKRISKIGMLHRLIGIIISGKRRGRLRRCTMSSLGFAPQHHESIHMASRRVGRLRKLRSGKDARRRGRHPRQRGHERGGHNGCHERQGSAQSGGRTPTKRSSRRHVTPRASTKDRGHRGHRCGSHNGCHKEGCESHNRGHRCHRRGRGNRGQRCQRHDGCHNEGCGHSHKRGTSHRGDNKNKRGHRCHKRQGFQQRQGCSEGGCRNKGGRHKRRGQNSGPRS